MCCHLDSKGREGSVKWDQEKDGEAAKYKLING